MSFKVMWYLSMNQNLHNPLNVKKNNGLFFLKEDSCWNNGIIACVVYSTYEVQNGLFSVVPSLSDEIM